MALTDQTWQMIPFQNLLPRRCRACWNAPAAGQTAAGILRENTFRGRMISLLQWKHQGNSIVCYSVQELCNWCLNVPTRAKNEQKIRLGSRKSLLKQRQDWATPVGSWGEVTGFLCQVWHLMRASSKLPLLSLMIFFIKFRRALGSASFVYAHLKEKLQLVNPGTKLFFMNSKSVMPPPRLDIKNICHF